MRFRGFVLFLIAAAGLASVRPAQAQTAYAIGDGGASLLTFSVSNPGSVNRVGFFGGFNFLDAIDFRPATGELFGYSDSTDSYFRVNTATGALTLASASPVGATTNTFRLGMDFNPTIDRLRVVTDSTQNLVYNPLTGTAAAFTPLAYAPGDVNAGVVPRVIENAYTNNRPEAMAPGQTTTQYVLDSGTGSLATLNNNMGMLFTVGQVRLAGTDTLLAFDQFTGFDIFTTSGGADTAYAVFRVNGTSGLYSINLGTAEATALGSFGSGFGDIYSLAVTTVAPVPVPPTLVGVMGGVLVLGLRSARRRILG